MLFHFLYGLMVWADTDLAVKKKSLSQRKKRKRKKKKEKRKCSKDKSRGGARKA